MKRARRTPERIAGVAVDEARDGCRARLAGREALARAIIGGQRDGTGRDRGGEQQQDEGAPDDDRTL